MIHKIKIKKIGILLISILIFSCNAKKSEIENVINFKGQQVTGVTVSNKGRVFANFPRWRVNVKNSVVEVFNNGTAKAFPNEAWNSWKLGQAFSDQVFVAVQSVVAFENILYVLDTRNPLFKGVIDAPKIFAFDLNSHQIIKTYTLSKESFHNDSYINDLRVDKKKSKIYFTDSGHAGIVVLDLNTGTSFRVLDNHKSTLAETNQLTFDNGVWTNTVHSDGIALDTKNDVLYYHALTGYSLYAIATDKLTLENNSEIENNVQFIAKTAAPDGMIIDEAGALFYADLENNKIMQLELSSGQTKVVAEGNKVKWADTFSLYKNTLYYTNSRINEAQGNINEMDFSINKIKINEAQ